MILVVVVLLLSLWLVFTYNGLVKRRNEIENVFGSIDVMLKKRHDLIPNLVEVARQYMQHESETLSNIAGLRSRALSGNIGTEEKIELENSISKAMGGIMVAVEDYPELKANDQFTMLQRSWNETEEQISAARRAFNAAVTDYNNAIEIIPTTLVAKMLGYTRKSVFEIPEEERANVSAKALFED